MRYDQTMVTGRKLPWEFCDDQRLRYADNLQHRITQRDPGEAFGIKAITNNVDFLISTEEKDVGNFHAARDTGWRIKRH